ncbi:MAG TPA: phycobilisome rod-core linker polypeptide [Chroococcidiopsis sp.]
MTSVNPITVNRRSSLEERQFALFQIYQQVLERQPYSYEHKLLAKPEKDFLSDKIGVRRFLKELGRSKVYLDSFYYSSSNLKFIELSFKHFMGRAPIDQEEVQHYCNVLMKGGVDKLITELLDSEEYRKVFGCFTVPYVRPVNYYSSPKAYIESKILNHEHVGQRGRIVPTMYWHQLGLDCSSGVCRHPEANEVLQPMTPTSELVQEELIELLKALDSPKAKEVVAALTPQQKAALRKVMHR